MILNIVKRERGCKRKRYVPSTPTFTNLFNIMLTITLSVAVAVNLALPLYF